MERLWAPWRIEYVRMEKMEGCIFCKFPRDNRDEENLILYRGKYAFIIMNNYPYNPGHVMVAPYRHVGNLEDLSDEEVLEMHHLTSLAIRAIKNAMNPGGFNIGINIGRVAGAGIEGHVHVHIVPRWNGDTNFMPVLADTKVIVQGIRENYSELRKELEKIISSSERP
ncbi:HIT family hydrolase, diadenosine tetraphosphate hydrolase [Aciduliprofundum sp. MAR08-339]|uniref:HIT family protein n=1 Tax=Aciduliprofundum sp. (strain MAR08-339) TaxID=673860 RepID=UPI0002A4A02B|nr:HIT family hydrolase, diadenosine tetraphosphate hydrolase [Aciduliprofundum sp. MAR08-339]